MKKKFYPFFDVYERYFLETSDGVKRASDLSKNDELFLYSQSIKTPFKIKKKEYLKDQKARRYKHLFGELILNDRDYFTTTRDYHKLIFETIPEGVTGNSISSKGFHIPIDKVGYLNNIFQESYYDDFLKCYITEDACWFIGLFQSVLQNFTRSNYRDEEFWAIPFFSSYPIKFYNKIIQCFDKLNLKYVRESLTDSVFVLNLVNDKNGLYFKSLIYDKKLKSMTIPFCVYNSSPTHRLSYLGGYFELTFFNEKDYNLSFPRYRGVYGLAWARDYYLMEDICGLGRTLGLPMKYIDHTNKLKHTYFDLANYIILFSSSRVLEKFYGLWPTYYTKNHSVFFVIKPRDNRKKDYKNVYHFHNVRVPEALKFFYPNVSFLNEDDFIYTCPEEYQHVLPKYHISHVKQENFSQENFYRLHIDLNKFKHLNTLNMNGYIMRSHNKTPSNKQNRNFLEC